MLDQEMRELAKKAKLTSNKTEKVLDKIYRKATSIKLKTDNDDIEKLAAEIEDLTEE